MKNEFAVHLLNDTGIAKANEMAEAFSTLLEKAEEIMPAGRDLAIVKTKLEEASFFAKRGLASIPEHQIDPVPPGAGR